MQGLVSSPLTARTRSLWTRRLDLKPLSRAVTQGNHRLHQAAGSLGSRKELQQGSFHSACPAVHQPKRLPGRAGLKVMAARSALDEMDDKGEFKRKDSTYRDFVKKGSKYEPAGMFFKVCAVCCLKLHDQVISGRKAHHRQCPQLELCRS